MQVNNIFSGECVGGAGVSWEQLARCVEAAGGEDFHYRSVITDHDAAACLNITNGSEFLGVIIRVNFCLQFCNNPFAPIHHLISENEERVKRGPLPPALQLVI